MRRRKYHQRRVRCNRGEPDRRCLHHQRDGRRNHHSASYLGGMESVSIILTTSQSWPSSTEVRLIAFNATLWPQRRIICDYSWGHLDGSGSFVPDFVPGATDTRVK